MASGYLEDRKDPDLQLAGRFRGVFDPIQKRYPLFGFIAFECCRYVWHSFKNCIKLLLGREPYREERLTFLPKYILHRLGISPIWALTSAIDNEKEGAGAQAFHIVSAIGFARAAGFTYLHSPFKKIAHADRPMQEWAAAWESLFNLGAGEVPYEGQTRGVIHQDFRPCAYDMWSVFDLCFGWRGRDEDFRLRLMDLMPEFRRKYYVNKSPRTTDEVTVALHVRRGDVTQQHAAYKYTATESVLRIARAIKASLDAHAVPSSIRVYSQGAPEDFAELSQLGAELVLDADPIWTFQQLVEADILVAAKSCYSHYAGFMSDGIKLFENSWHWSLIPSTDDWIPCTDDGSFDAAAFQRQLILLLEEKAKAQSASQVHESK